MKKQSPTVSRKLNFLLHLVAKSGKVSENNVLLPLVLNKITINVQT